MKNINPPSNSNNNLRDEQNYNPNNQPILPSQPILPQPGSIIDPNRNRDTDSYYTAIQSRNNVIHPKPAEAPMNNQKNKPSNIVNSNSNNLAARIPLVDAPYKDNHNPTHRIIETKPTLKTDRSTTANPQLIQRDSVILDPHEEQKLSETIINKKPKKIVYASAKSHSLSVTLLTVAMFGTMLCAIAGWIFYFIATSI